GYKNGKDYNIVFPDALVSERHWHATKEPVVILLGWAGCRDKHLVKYSSIYNEQGCVTICYTELRNTAHKLLEILYDYEVENSHIFFHVFSNGGFMLYRYIVELLHSHKQFSTLYIVGAVVDSAPGSGNVRGALRALKATLGPNINVMLRYVLLALFAVTVFLLRVVLYPVTKYIHKDHYDAIRERPPTWPQLYLYSRADRVIRYSDVELMVKALKEKGVSVESFDFKTPAHVSHFCDFPEEYSKRCLAFLTNCMKDSEGTQTKKRCLIQH
uniref:Transmembrane protein 53 n=1 Tax=Hucho hucho TaxID=62062 RepID=A0A4W5K413_9TELE